MSAETRPVVTDKDLRRALEIIAADVGTQVQDRLQQILERLGGIPAVTAAPSPVTEFVLTSDHLTLLRHANVTWSAQEWGGPQIDPKRPFGNGDLWRDVARILGWPAAADPEAEDGFYAHYDAAKALYGELLTALEIVLATASFQPGRYVRDGGSWSWVASS